MFHFHLKQNGEFVELQQILDSKIVAISSSDPNSENYSKILSPLTKSTPHEQFEEAQGQYLVSSDPGLYIPPIAITQQTIEGNTFTYTKASHGFPVPSAAAWDGTDWIAADKDTAVDVFVIVSATANTFTVGLNGSHQVNHGLGNNPGPIYLGDPPNNLTRTAPPVGQVPKKQIILGQVLSSNHLWIQPEWRAA